MEYIALEFSNFKINRLSKSQNSSAIKKENFPYKLLQTEQSS